MGVVRDRRVAAVSTARPRLVAREESLAELRRSLEDPPSLVLVEGEAGVGKTRLLTEALSTDRTTGKHCLWVRCPPLAEPYTLGPVVEALLVAANDRVHMVAFSELAGALRPLFPEWSTHLPPALEPADDAGTARHRVFRALVMLLDDLGIDTVVIDDLQWSDAVTREFLVFLAGRRDARVRLVMAHRAHEGGDWLPQFTSRLRPAASLLRLSLRPLDVDDTAALASSTLADQPVSQAFAEHLHGHTGGLPLAIEESLRLMVRRKDLVWRDGAWSRLPLAEIVVPPTVRDAVLEQAARLESPATAVLRAAAVAGDPLSEPSLMRLTDLTEEAFLNGLAECLDHGMLANDQERRVCFRHMLAARAVYEAIPERERRSLHRRRGLLLEEESTPQLARLADHFRHAGDAARWQQYADRAAEVALETGDERTAGALLLELSTAPDISAQRLCALVDKVPFGSIPSSQQLHDLVRNLRRMLDRGGHTPSMEAKLRFQLSRVLTEVDEFDAARTEVERALPDLQRDPASVAISMVLLGWPRGTMPRETSLSWLDRAGDLAADLTPAGRLLIDTTRAPALLLHGDDRGWAGAAAIPMDADTSRERRIVTMAHVNMGDAALRWGRYDVAAGWLETAHELAVAHDQVRLAELAACTQAHLDWCTGNWAGLEERASDLVTNDDIRPVGRLEPLMVRALLRLADGETTTATDELEQVITGARDYGGWESVAEPSAALARLHLRAGRVAAALEATQDPVHRALRTGWLWGLSLVPIRVAALVQSGDVVAASDLVDRFEAEVVQPTPVPPAGLAAVLECRSVLASRASEYDRAAALLQQAAVHWSSRPHPYRAADCGEQQGLALLAGGKVEDGLDVLEQTHASYAALPAAGDADRVATVLREHGRGGARGWRGGRKGYGRELSPRELEVVALAAQGHTNREIGERLHRSHHTVGTQIRSAMRKLEVGSRAALAVKAAASGLLDSSD